MKTYGRIKHDIRVEYFAIPGKQGRQARYTLHEPETAKPKEATAL